MYLEYRAMNLLCVDFIVSRSQNIHFQEKLCPIILICLTQMTITRMTK